ncbi:MAG: DUF2177 family protein [Erysipelotrichaceae bacterium]|jgi:uncharacterized membrane protein|nr:DUF2177 family protein [Erysipelothrix sp.]MDP2814736.1 DUF2177 family protein [Erysipelotrichaceae bacterium]MDP3304635.1 DUF2177 family protein [Erysipelotrichaceae bacterium]
MKLVSQFLVVLVVFFAIDLFWLGVVAKDLYAKYLGYLMAPQINWAAAITFYLLFIVGLMIFVLLPALDKQSLSHALIYGALFGFFTYATYDLTNLATIRDWPITITIIDLIWGTSLSAAVSSISYLIITTFLK